MMLFICGSLSLTSLLFYSEKNVHVSLNLYPVFKAAESLKTAQWHKDTPFKITGIYTP